MTAHKDFIWEPSENTASALSLQEAADALLSDPYMAILYHDESGEIEALRGTAEALLVFKAWCYIDKKLFCVAKSPDSPPNEKLIVADAELEEDLIHLHSARYATDKDGADKEFFRWYRHHSAMEKAAGRGKLWDESEVRHLVICSVDDELRPKGNPRVIRMEELDEEQRHGYGVYKGERVFISNWGTKERCEELLKMKTTIEKHKQGGRR